MTEPVFVSARDNPLLVKLRKLARDPAAYRKLATVWLEGEHLCSALRQRGQRPEQAVLTESAWADPALRALAQWAPRCALLPDALFEGLSALESPARLGFVLRLPVAPAMDPVAASVVLDRVQDAGNVGAILRSAAAFGFSQVIALKGTAALWSPKVLRAGMGAHFGLSLLDGAEPEVLAALAVPLVVTSSHAGLALHQLLRQARLPMPCAWAFGHEGQGVGPELMARAGLQVRIAQPGGEESLNVASAAAICLHASATAALV